MRTVVGRDTGGPRRGFRHGRGPGHRIVTLVGLRGRRCGRGRLLACTDAAPDRTGAASVQEAVAMLNKDMVMRGVSGMAAPVPSAAAEPDSGRYYFRGQRQPPSFTGTRIGVLLLDTAPETSAAVP